MTAPTKVAQPPSTASTFREGWVDRTRGLCILLVIFGHVIISSIDARQISDDGFWGAMRQIVYAVHIPAFMFLSGLFVSRRIAHGIRRFARDSVVTLVWPYLLWGGIALLAQQLGRGLRSDVETNAIDLSLLWTPIAWLWFLWALALYHVLAVMFRRSLWLLPLMGFATLAADAALDFGQFTSRLAHFLLFYGAGVWIGHSSKDFRFRINGLVAVTVACATIACSVASFTYGAPFWSFPTVPAELLGTVAVCALCLRVGGTFSKLLSYLGRRSLPLFLTHFFFITATRVALDRGANIQGFAIVLPCCFLTATLGLLALNHFAARLRLTVAAGFGKAVHGNFGSSSPAEHEVGT